VPRKLADILRLGRARNLHPSGFPAWTGQEFWLIGYRIFVRYVNAQG
jgi:hypothetical protein